VKHKKEYYAPYDPARTAVRGDYSPDEVLVLVDERLRGNVKRLVARRYNLQPLDAFRVEMLHARGWRFRILGARTVRHVVKLMRGDPRIKVVQPNFFYRLQSPNTIRGSWQAQYAVARIDLLAAHAISRGADSTIAVIDTEVDWKHPEFSGTRVKSYDATSNTGVSRPNQHGTAVTGIIAARSQLLGVAPSATLLSIKAFSQTTGNQPLATSQSLWKAINWAYRNGARVLNLSFAGRHAEPGLHRLLKYVHAHGVIPVAAAGNGGSGTSPAYPAAYPEVIAVTATDDNDTVYDHANSGSYIELAAPGVSVLSPALGAIYEMPSGTSLAAAHVSGLVALMLSVDPSLTVRQVRTVLAASARDQGKPGRDEIFGFGRINAHGALNILVKLKRHVEPIASVTPPKNKPD
jgi:subtilisin family serine protease